MYLHTVYLIILSSIKHKHQYNIQQFFCVKTVTEVETEICLLWHPKLDICASILYVLCDMLFRYVAIIWTNIQNLNICPFSRFLTNVFFKQTFITMATLVDFLSYIKSGTHCRSQQYTISIQYMNAYCTENIRNKYWFF